MSAKATKSGTTPDTGPNGGPSFTKLLAVCSLNDSDAETLRAAAALADAWGARLTAMVVIEEDLEPGAITQATGVPLTEIERRLFEHYRNGLKETVERVLPGRPVDLDDRMGKPFLQIIHKVVEGGYDMVIKAAETLSGLDRYLFASTDQHLLRKCPCPVWLRLPEKTEPIKKVLATVDVDRALASEPETLTGLNRRIIETATQIARSSTATVDVLHVWEAPGEGLVRLWSDTADPNTAVADYVANTRATHWRALTDLTKQARAWAGADLAEQLRFNPKLERGVARDVIPEQARALGADILIMGTVARTGVPGFFIGNTAEDVLNSIGCSVVTVKPPHYVSPVVLDQPV